VIAAKEEQIVFAKPAFDLHKAAAGFPRFAFRYERAFLAAERVHVYVGAVAPIAHRAGMGHALAMNAEREMQGDDFALAPITLTAMTRTTLLFPCGDLVRGWLLLPNSILFRSASEFAFSTQSRKRIIPINRHFWCSIGGVGTKKSPGRAGAVQVKP
jgi:hypothetical protein